MAPLHDFPTVFATRDCRFGRMTYPEKDLYVGRSLALYGEFSPGEAALFQEWVAPGDVVVEVGANLGAHTVLLARLVGPEGAVLAFEPQPGLFQVLCANLAQNQITNVVAEPKGLGRRNGFLHIPPLDYGREENFGGLSLELTEVGLRVPVTLLDAYRLQACAFLKIDVEGMETQVLEGAADTLHRLRPVLFVENDRREQSPDLIAMLQAMDYRLYWHLAPLYDPANFAGNPENVFGQVVSANMLCVPRERAQAVPLREVTGADDYWQA